MIFIEWNFGPICDHMFLDFCQRSSVVFVLLRVHGTCWMMLTKALGLLSWVCYPSVPSEL